MGGRKFLIILTIISISSIVIAKKRRKFTGVKDELDRYSKCDGKSITIPSEILSEAIIAASKCTGYDDDNCFRVCVAYNYGAMKNHKLSRQYLEKKSRAIDLNDTPELKPKLEELLNRGDDCAKPHTFSMPDTGDRCTAAQTFRECVEDAFDEICKGKKAGSSGSGSSTDFLD